VIGPNPPNNQLSPNTKSCWGCISYLQIDLGDKAGTISESETLIGTLGMSRFWPEKMFKSRYYTLATEKLSEVLIIDRLENGIWLSVVATKDGWFQISDPLKGWVAKDLTGGYPQEAKPGLS